MKGRQVIGEEGRSWGKGYNRETCLRVRLYHRIVKGEKQRGDKGRGCFVTISSFSRKVRRKLQQIAKLSRPWCTRLWIVLEQANASRNNKAYSVHCHTIKHVYPKTTTILQYDTVEAHSCVDNSEIH